MADKQDARPAPPRPSIDITLPLQPLKVEDRDQLPTSDKGIKRLGLAILLVAFGGFGTWAVTAKLAVAVVAPGSVSIETFKRTIQHLEGGIVREILVEDGDRVEAGDPLVVLSDTQARAQLDIARS